MTEPSEFIAQIIHQFSSWYAPAADIAHATDFLSTAEIVEALSQFNPGAEVDSKLIFDAMTEAGYWYCPDPGKMTFQLKWMIIRKQ